MRIIKIQANENGSHDNQFGPLLEAPDGYAIIPDEMEIPDTFPFVNITVKKGVVTSMEAGEVPPPEPEPETDTADDIINALLGVTE